MKISIIMPTYNDATSIEETLQSVITQKYKNWELHISDDGSTDNTHEIITKFIHDHKETRIKYYHQDNQDQLNAITNVSGFIARNSLVLILHSDDILASPNVFQNIINYFEKFDVDAIIANLPLINENSQDIGIQKTRKYKSHKYIPALQLLWLGRNLYADTFVAKESVFNSSIKENYLTWNTPFWLSYEDEVKMLNVHTVDFSIIKYRVFEGNYINNEIGKLNVINGELRTATNLMAYYDIPIYKLQYFLFRVLNKIHLKYIPWYQNKESRNKAQIIKFIIEKRFGKNNPNVFLQSLIGFYNNYHKRTIILEVGDNICYYGKDMRKFNNDLINNNLPELYLNIFAEMQKGFDKILVKNKVEKKKIEIITKFLCIAPFVEVENVQS